MATERKKQQDRERMRVKREKDKTMIKNLLQVLVMVRDADDDSRSDGLQAIPDIARSRIDLVLAETEGHR